MICFGHGSVLRPNRSAQMGGEEVGRYGHGLGIQLTEPPSHTNWDKTEIKAGMALTIEPSINYGDGLTMVAEENLLILDDGLCYYPNALRAIYLSFCPLTEKEASVMSQSIGKSQTPMVKKFAHLPFRKASPDETAAQLGLITLKPILLSRLNCAISLATALAPKLGMVKNQQFFIARIACDDKVTSENLTAMSDRFGDHWPYFPRLSFRCGRVGCIGIL